MKELESVLADEQRMCPYCGVATPASSYCVNCGRNLRIPPQQKVSGGEKDNSQNRTALTVLGGCSGTAVFSCMAGCMGLLLLAMLPNPVALGLVITAAIVPAVFYSALVILLDRFEAEPWYTLLGAFLWGAVVATFFSLILNSLTGLVVLMAYGEETYGIFVPVIVAPIVEEITKGAALVVLLLAFRHEFDSTLDGIIYGALVGLGFAMTENMLYFSGFLLEAGVGGLIVGFFVRAGIGGFAHAIFTAATGGGIGWARSQYGKGRLRFIVPVAGLGLAMLLHAIWNLVAVVGSLLGVLMALLGIAGLFLFLVLPCLAIILGIAAWHWRHQIQILRVQLRDEVARGTLTRNEYEMLVNPQLRRSAAWQSLTDQGIRGWFRMRAFSRLASRLAFQKHHADQGEIRPVGIGKLSDEQLRIAIHRTRQQIVGT